MTLPLPELIAEMEDGLEGVTPGPWKVLSERHPWELPSRPEWGRPEKKSGHHTERRIYTSEFHPQLKGPYPIIELGFGITTEPEKSVPMVSISEENAAHIARCSPDNIAAIIAGYRQLQKENADLACHATFAKPIDILNDRVDARDAEVARHWQRWTNCAGQRTRR